MRALPALALAFLGLAGLPGCEDDEPEYVLVWSDEFDGEAGSLPNPANWSFDVGGGGWGNAQLEHNTNRPENASLDGEGHLLLTAREEDFGGNDYTSARIKTENLFEQQYGRFEARIKLPTGQGIWPAFWMLGANFDVVGWPQCGEIDIMEYRGQKPDLVLGTVHGPGFSGGASISSDFSLGRDRFDDGFHTFIVEWTEERITWFVDGIAYHRVRPRDLPEGTQWVFDQPFFMILNVAVGGNFVGSPNQSTRFPQTMTVDYVRVYARR